METVVTLIAYILLFHFVKKKKEKGEIMQPIPERWQESIYNYK